MRVRERRYTPTTGYRFSARRYCWRCGRWVATVTRGGAFVARPAFGSKGTGRWFCEAHKPPEFPL